jgi:CBS-domain-containing membrane protein
VAEFTEDVPLVRVIRVADVMEPGEASADFAGDPVRIEMTLEDILPRFAGGADALPVADSEGAVVGRVTPSGVVKALAAGEAG